MGSNEAGIIKYFFSLPRDIQRQNFGLVQDAYFLLFFDIEIAYRELRLVRPVPDFCERLLLGVWLLLLRQSMAGQMHTFRFSFDRKELPTGIAPHVVDCVGSCRCSEAPPRPPAPGPGGVARSSACTALSRFAGNIGVSCRVDHVSPPTKIRGGRQKRRKAQSITTEGCARLPAPEGYA